MNDSTIILVVNNTCSNGIIPLGVPCSPTGLINKCFDSNKPEGDWPFRDLTGCLMWIAYMAKKAIARYANPQKKRGALEFGILVLWDDRYMLCVFCKGFPSRSSSSISFQTGSGHNKSSTVK